MAVTVYSRHCLVLISQQTIIFRVDKKTNMQWHISIHKSGATSGDIHAWIIFTTVLEFADLMCRFDHVDMAKGNKKAHLSRRQWKMSHFHRACCTFYNVTGESSSQTYAETESDEWLNILYQEGEDRLNWCGSSEAKSVTPVGEIRKTNSQAYYEKDLRYSIDPCLIGTCLKVWAFILTA